MTSYNTRRLLDVTIKMSQFVMTNDIIQYTSPSSLAKYMHSVHPSLQPECSNTALSIIQHGSAVYVGMVVVVSIPLYNGKVALAFHRA